MSNSLMGGNNTQQGMQNGQGFQILAQLMNGIRQNQGTPQVPASNGMLGPSGRIIGQALQNPNGFGPGLGQAINQNYLAPFTSLLGGGGGSSAALPTSAAATDAGASTLGALSGATGPAAGAATGAAAGGGLGSLLSLILGML